MYRVLVLIVLATCMTLSGCGKSADVLAQKTLDSMKEMTAALEGGNKDQVMAVAKKMQAIMAEAKTQKYSKTENDRINEKYKPLIMEETKKMTNAMMQAVRSGKLKQEDLKELSSLVKPQV